MENNGKYKGPAEENNSEIMIDDLDTQELSDSSIDSELYDSSSDSCDSICTLPSDVTKHSVNKNDDSASTDSGKRKINDSDVPTAITEKEYTEKEYTENTEKLASYVRKVLRNEVHGEKDWSWFLVEANQSVNISQEVLKNIILHKSAEVIATHRKSQIAEQTSNYSYYKKYKRLLAHVNSVTSELELLQRVPDNQVYNVRNVGTNVNMPPKKE